MSASSAFPSREHSPYDSFGDEDLLPSTSRGAFAPDSTHHTGRSGTNNAFDDSDDEEAWDEVDVHQDNSASALAAAQPAKEISIVISKGGKKTKKKPDGSVTRDRMIRQQRHKAHATCQLAVGLIRNRYINDTLLQARLLSIVPLHIQNAFFTFSKATHPNERDRVRLFEAAFKDLLSWWYTTFDIVEEKGIRRRTVPEVEDELARWIEAAEDKNEPEASTSRFPWEGDAQTKKPAPSKKGKAKASYEWGPSEKEWEPLRSGVKSMMKHALQLEGSRDLSAQLFASLCRGLDIPTRLIFSLQPVDWHAPSAAAKSRSKSKKTPLKGVQVSDGGFTSDSDFSVGKGKGKGKASAATSGRDSAGEDVRGNKLGYKVPAPNLRKSKPPAKRAREYFRSPSPDLYEMNRPPVFWLEVWSRYNRTWITVDPARKKFRCKSIMEPGRSTIENQLLYVVAYEEDGSVRDVTPRYAKAYNNYTVKARAPSKKNTDWFKELLLPFERTFELNRDRDEKEELWKTIANEPFPTSIGGFKNHPNYVLEQHLHRDEVIRAGSRQLGLFKGTEPVFARSSVVELKSVENYWREGRQVKDNEIPMKWVKSRVVTINRKRAEAVATMDGEAPSEKALYAREQTRVYVPDPVVNGKVPRNSFGNIDLYVPSMLPAGAIHLPSKQAAKCAKKLEIDYAEAITGFEFRQRRANPIMTGVVIAEEYADALIQAIIESEEAAEEKEFAKRQERCLKRWRKLILGLRIRQRLQASYQDKGAGTPKVDKESQFEKKDKGKRAAPESDSDSSATAPRKRPATSSSVKSTPAPPVKRTSPRPSRTKLAAAAAVVIPSPVAAASLPTPPPAPSTTSGRSLRFTFSSPNKSSAAPTPKPTTTAPATRASVPRAAKAKPPTPPPAQSDDDDDEGTDGSLEYESDF